MTSTNTNVKRADEPTPTDLEIDIAKYEGKVAKMKHVDGRTFALDFCFPLLRRLAATLGDNEDDIAEIGELVSQMAGSADEVIETLEASRDLIAKMAGLLDEIMVEGGFCTVTRSGLVLTEKISAASRAKYEEIGPEAVEVVGAIQEAIEESARRAEASDVDEEDDGEMDTSGATDLDGDVTSGPAGAIAEAALTAAVADVAPVVAIAPVVEGGANGTA